MVAVHQFWRSGRKAREASGNGSCVKLPTLATLSHKLLWANPDPGLGRCLGLHQVPSLPRAYVTHLKVVPPKRTTEISFTVLYGAKLCSRFFSTWPIFVAIKVASELLSIFNASDLTANMNSCLYPSPPCPHLSKQNLCCWWGGALSQRDLSITDKNGRTEQQCSHLPPGFK